MCGEYPSNIIGHYYFFCITFAVCNAGYFGTGSNGCNLCTGNMTKPEAGDAATCDQVCDPESSRPNDQRTTCGEYTVAIRTQSVIWRAQLKTPLKTK